MFNEHYSSTENQLEIYLCSWSMIKAEINVFTVFYFIWLCNNMHIILFFDRYYHNGFVCMECEYMDGAANPVLFMQHCQFWP